MEYYNCSSKQITKLENLPESLHTLVCSSNQITKLENLPESLHTLDCGSNWITKLENLPLGLTWFSYTINYVTHVDNVKYDRIKFTLKGYQAIRRIQRRIRYRYDRKVKAAVTIQRGCHNWVFSGKCKDNTVGIMPRLEWRKLQEELGNCI